MNGTPYPNFNRDIAENEKFAKVGEEIVVKTKILESFEIPPHDTQIIDETDPNNVIITYKKSGATVATKTINVVGLITTISVVIS